MKKLGIKLLGLSIMGLLGFGLVTANGTTFNQGGFGTTTDAGGIAGVTDASGTSKQGGLIQVIKNFINRVLGILSLITLVILLWGGFQMVTAAGDEGKFKNGMKILKQAAIGLAFIGLAWFVVSIIFWVLGGVTGGA